MRQRHVSHKLGSQDVDLGGPGSGNWAHAGRPGQRGGSQPREGGMSLKSGQDWLRRYETVKGRKHPFEIWMEKTREEEARKTEEARKAEAAARAATKVPINERNSAAVRRKLTEDYGYREADMKDALALIEGDLKANPIAINVKSRVFLDYVLPAGRFANQHETGASGGVLNPSFRKDVERKVFSDKLKKPEDFPTYGWIKSDHATNRVSSYGDISVVLKEGVKDRATFTVDDSLYAFSNGSGAPSPVRRPSVESLDTSLISGKLNSWISYIEVQIFGGVKLSDIEYVDLRGCTDVNVSKQIGRELEKLGIRYRWRK